MLAPYLTGTNAGLLALAVVLVMFILFVREDYPAEVVAISGVSVMLLTGLLPYDLALGVLSNPAPWTIAAMFLVMGALVRTARWRPSRGSPRPRPARGRSWP